MTNVLFVCTGNTCRSPMAEALLKHKGSSRYEAKSAGLFANMGSQAHPNALEALTKRGIEFDHRSQPATVDLVEWAHLIFTMTEQHKQLLLQQFPEAINKVFTLKEYVLTDGEYDKVYRQLQKATANFEAKRAKYTYGLNTAGLSAEERDEIKRSFQNETKEDRARLQELQSKLPGIDIGDPFGGTSEAYENVYKELDTLISRLIDKKN
ncbi:protein-tyrosine phosphatase [Scopulibacillus darangshiensis]|uniref:Protein-tyrosine phosphatase n=1 Tax=Scopulibacillus darangshiensis TaxID=442528 RepID=A0A4R2NGB2_9BACL|nr:low molecular weight protein arginine phosphatase [Scopulibacillus darangshiensis]TCP20248.1 protein-tyrosine phosphatase [Scopulibacillus darangshiensis]